MNYIDFLIKAGTLRLLDIKESNKAIQKVSNFDNDDLALINPQIENNGTSILCLKFLKGGTKLCVGVI